MVNFDDAHIASMREELKAMAAANQVTVTLKQDGQTFGGWATSNLRFGDGLEYVLLLDTEFGFMEKFPEGLTAAARLQRSSSRAAFELSLRLCTHEADGSLTQIESYNPVIAWSAENQKRCPYRTGDPPFCSRALYDKKVTKTLREGSRELVTEKEAYEGLQVHLARWKVTHALTTTNCITCGSYVQTCPGINAGVTSRHVPAADVRESIGSDMSRLTAGIESGNAAK
jgi:hypothetical protein